MFTEKDFTTNSQKIITSAPKKLEIKAEAPSNIALVKYWGKTDVQIPINPSISFTLNKSKTVTKAQLELLKTQQEHIHFEFYLDNERKKEFETKIAVFFERIFPYVPFINLYKWKLESKNTFPHSSGIASSASGFAALAKIIINLEKQLYPNQPDTYYQRKTSFLARLGSGSAARSTEQPVMIWGKHPEIPETSNLYAIKNNFKLHSVFHDFQNTIVLVDKDKKQISSTTGHQIMNNHPYKIIRKNQAFENAYKMYQILQNGNLEDFIKITEAEALTLHALMMTSEPNYILMKPQTLQLIHQIREIRQNKNLPVCFTLDAGANIHILYPKPIQQELKNLLFDNLKQDIIFDYL